MNLDLNGKCAVVCGSTQGLGLAAATELALLGAEVVLMSRNEEKLQQAVNSLSTAHHQVHSYLVADFQNPGEVKNKIENFLSAGKDVHILVNNTGGPPPGNTKDATPDDFLGAFNAHLICNQLLAQAIIPSMKGSGYGRIVNIISTSVREPIPGLAVSNTIRGAVAAWAKTLANEVGKFGITVNNVLPGYTKTARYDALVQTKKKNLEKSEEEVEDILTEDIPLRRIGKPAEFGSVVAFLCSPSASYITGVSLPVDGGKISGI